MWRTSRQACLLCPWVRQLTGCLHLYVADWWSSRTSPDYNCKVANPACCKRRLLVTHQWQSALLVVGLPVTQDWIEMGCHLSPSLISIRLTVWTWIAVYAVPPSRGRGGVITNKQTNIKMRCITFDLKYQQYNVNTRFFKLCLVIHGPLFRLTVKHCIVGSCSKWL